MRHEMTIDNFQDYHELIMDFKLIARRIFYNQVLFFCGIHYCGNIYVGSK